MSLVPGEDVRTQESISRQALEPQVKLLNLAPRWGLLPLGQDAYSLGSRTSDPSGPASMVITKMYYASCNQYVTYIESLGTV